MQISLDTLSGEIFFALKSPKNGQKSHFCEKSLTNTAFFKNKS